VDRRARDREPPPLQLPSDRIRLHPISKKQPYFGSIRSRQAWVPISKLRVALNEPKEPLLMLPAPNMDRWIFYKKKAQPEVRVLSSADIQFVIKTN